MKHMKICIVLLALLLAAMAMVPMVGAQTVNITSDNAQIIETNYITKDTALKDAKASLLQFTDNALLDNTFIGATVNPEPTTIYDINGMKLFYLFTIVNGKKSVGEIKIAASKVLGASLISIGPGSGPINYPELNRNAIEILSKQGVAADLSSARFVCYAYPRIGLMINVPATESSTDRTLIIDAYDYSVIPPSGQTSLYGSLSLSTMTSGTAQWNAQATDSDGTMTRALSPKATVSKTLSGFTLYPQQGTNWCAFASAQMITQWYGYSKTQQQIASTVGVNPDNGATEVQMRDGYYTKTLANGGLGKSGSYILLGSPSNLYDLIKTEIDANRPLVINIGIQPGQSTNYHARACAGYSRDTGNLNTYFYIYDPWPVTSGSLTWERWLGNSMPYTSSIFVRS